MILGNHGIRRARFKKAKFFPGDFRPRTPLGPPPEPPVPHAGPQPPGLIDGGALPPTVAQDLIDGGALPTPWPSDLKAP